METWIAIQRKSYRLSILRESPTTSGQRITAVASSTMFLEAFQNSLGGVRMWSSLKQKFFLNSRLALEGGQPNGSKGKGDGRAKWMSGKSSERGLTSKHLDLVLRRAQCKMEWMLSETFKIHIAGISFFLWRQRWLSNLPYAAKYLYICFLSEKSITC